MYSNAITACEKVMRMRLAFAERIGFSVGCLTGYSQAGQWVLALQLFREMDQLGMQRDGIAFNSIISALAKGKSWRRAVEVFDEMKSEEIEPTVFTFSALITACARGKVHSILKIGYF